MTTKGWQRRFQDPIALADGRELLTLRDAGEYIAALPAKMAKEAHWQTATGELLIAAEQGILMLAEIAMRRAINHGREPPAKEPRRKMAKKYRVISNR